MEHVERIACRPTDCFDSVLSTLKRDALLFDRVAISDLRTDIGWWRSATPNPTTEETIEAEELEYLFDKGFLFTPAVDINNPKFSESAVYKDYLRAQSALSEVFMQSFRDAINRQPGGGTKVVEYDLGDGLNTHCLNARINAVLLELELGVKAVPLLPVGPTQISSNDPRPPEARDVIEIVFNDMPVPGDNVSWEHIEDLRANPKLKQQRGELLCWVETVSTGGRGLAQIEEEYRDLSSAREAFLKDEKVEFRNGVMSALVIAGVELAAKPHEVPYGAIAAGIFEIRKSIRSLFTSEDKGPGREIAYTSSVKRRIHD